MTNAARRGLFGRVLRAPMMVKAGAGCGVVAGLTLGFMVSAPVGIILGLSLGASIGIVAGIVMDRDEQRSSLRTRELDDIIGITSGSMGARDVPSIPPPEEVSRQQELSSWLAEWMTPPPPSVT